MKNPPKDEALAPRNAYASKIEPLDAVKQRMKGLTANVAPRIIVGGERHKTSL